MIIATILSAIHGMVIVVYVIVFSDVAKKLAESHLTVERICNFNDTVPDEVVLDEISDDIYQFLALAGAVFVGSFGNALWRISTDRQMLCMRKNVMRSILRQDLSWFDKHTPGMLINYQAESMITISRGMGSSFGTLVQTICGCIGAIAVGFSYQWKVTLVLLSVIPLVSLTTFAVNKVVKISAYKENLAYEKAGDMTEEVISSIKTVVAFGGEKKEIQR
uniref:ABC transmembrane type-1 domain-containing protein n=1 Tax=Octopus bimaculoides TaxID=37653 RepID=A0A0L8GKH3_OCTBM